ncbi:MAG: DUF1922 domain-containing protein [Candidatus Ranarchaeia archaeon]|jgi:hypothetical protein
MYLVFRCPRCGHFLYSPFGQKTRHCPYCTKIVKIDPKAAHLAENDETARNLVKQYNAGENLKNFLKLRRRDGEQISPEFFNPAKVDIRKDENAKQQKLQKIRDQQVLRRILTKFAVEPRSLKELDIIFSENNLDIDWVHEELSRMVQAKQVALPRPWEIQYLLKPPTKPAHKGGIGSNQDIPKAEIQRLLINFFQNSPHPVSIKDTRLNFSFFKNSNILDDILQKLLQQGIIYEPKSELYLWTGEK